MPASAPSDDSPARPGDDFYRLVVDSLEDHAVFTTDTSGTITSWNAGAQKLLGYTEQEALGKNSRIIFTKDDIKKKAHIKERQLARSEGRALDERWHVRKDGSLLWGFGMLKPLKDKAENIIGFTKVMRDLTERKLADDERKKLATIVDSTADAIYTRTIDGIITSWNAGAALLYGYNSNEVIGKPITIVVPPEKRDELKKIVQKVTTEGVSVENVETERIRKDKKKLIVSVTFSPIKDEHGKVTEIAVIARNMTEQRAAEAALKQQLALTETVTNTTTACLFMIDENGLTTFMNPAGERITGYTPPEVIGKSLHVLIHHSKPDGSPYPESECSFVTMYKRGEPGPLHEDVFFRKDGTAFNALVLGQPIPGPGGTRGTVIELRDITEEKQSQERLRLSEERLRLATRAAVMIGTWDWHIPTDRLYSDDRFAELFSVSSDQAEQGAPLSVYLAGIHPDDVERVNRAMQRAIDTGSEYTQEYRLLNRDGSMRWIIAQGQCHYDEAGGPNRFTGAVVDITERKAVEEDLRKFKFMSDHSSDALILMRRDGTFAYLNDLALKLWGYTRMEAGKLRVPDVDPSYRDEVFAKVFEKAQRQSLPTFETMHKRKDGTTYPVEINMRGLTLDDEPYMFAVARDITLRKEAEQALRAQSELTKNITDNATTGLIIMDDRQHCTFMNPAAEALTGFTFQQIQQLDKPLHDIIHHKRPDGRPYPMADCPIDRALPEKNQTQGEDVFVRPDGSFYPVAFTASPIIRNGRAVGTVIEVRDTTEEKAREQEIRQLNQNLEKRVVERTEELTAANKELARSNIELEDFAYVASHDLQEPLRKITAFAGLLASDYKKELPPEASKYIEGLQRSSTRMRTLIEDLLTYSRVTTKVQPFKTIDLNKILEDVLEDLQASITDTQAKIDIKKLCSIEGDPLQIRLLLQNLISNALKYRKDDVRPTINIYSKDKKDCCIIYIQDNGIGFDETYTDRIFTIFQRLHGRSRYEGTGIGLAICKKIVDRHGGLITASSNEGVGSTFIVTLPKKQK